MKNMEPKTVWLPYGAAGRIAKALRTTTKTVSEAINGKINSDLGRKIRYVAIKEYGGVVVKYERAFCPDCDTVRDSRGDMESVFTDRVKIIYSEAAKKAAVYIDGELRESAKVETIADYMDFERRVQQVADSLVS